MLSIDSIGIIFAFNSMTHGGQRTHSGRQQWQAARKMTANRQRINGITKDRIDGEWKSESLKAIIALNENTIMLAWSADSVPCPVCIKCLMHNECDLFVKEYGYRCITIDDRRRRRSTQTWPKCSIRFDFHSFFFVVVVANLAISIWRTLVFDFVSFFCCTHVEYYYFARKKKKMDIGRETKTLCSFAECKNSSNSLVRYIYFSFILHS